MKGALLILVGGMLVSGSVNTISKKLGYGTCSTSPIAGGLQHGRELPGVHPKRSPVSETVVFLLVMFTGEAMCLLLFFYRRARAAARSRGAMKACFKAAAYSPYSFGDSAVHSQMASPAL